MDRADTLATIPPRFQRNIDHQWTGGTERCYDTNCKSTMITIEATFRNGVLVPVKPPALAENERVRLVIEPIADNGARHSQIVKNRRHDRIQLNPELSQDIASSVEFGPEET